MNIYTPQTHPDAWATINGSKKFNIVAACPKGGWAIVLFNDTDGMPVLSGGTSVPRVYIEGEVCVYGKDGEELP